MFRRKNIQDITYDFKSVFVKFEYSNGINCEVKDCLIPAKVKIDIDDNIQIVYETIYNYNIFRAYYVYNRENCPDLFCYDSFDLVDVILISDGVLLEYDEINDIINPVIDYKNNDGKNIYVKWRDIEPLYSNLKTDDGKLLKNVKD